MHWGVTVEWISANVLHANGPSTLVRASLVQLSTRPFHTWLQMFQVQTVPKEFQYFLQRTDCNAIKGRVVQRLFIFQEAAILLLSFAQENHVQIQWRVFILLVHCFRNNRSTGLFDTSTDQTTLVNTRSILDILYSAQHGNQHKNAFAWIIYHDPYC